MSRWTIMQSIGRIVKDGQAYDELDLSWLPDPILCVQSPDGVTCELENGIRATETHTHNTQDVATSSLAWWPNVSTTWQAAYDAEQAAEAAAAAAEAAAAAAEEETPA